MRTFIHNGRVAWELDRDIGLRYQDGTYLFVSFLGWKLVDRLKTQEWKRTEGGWFKYRQKVMKANLKEVANEAQG